MAFSTCSSSQRSKRMLWALVLPIAIGGLGFTCRAADTALPPAAPADASTPAPAAAAPADVPAPAPDLATGQHPSLDYFNNWQTSPTLTGDWGGIRKQMADKGLTFDFTLVQVYQGVVNGGLDKGWQYGGRDDVAINLDTQKMGIVAGRIPGMWRGKTISVNSSARARPARFSRLTKTPSSPSRAPTAMNCHRSTTCSSSRTNLDFTPERSPPSPMTTATPMPLPTAKAARDF